jgi:hypothetical protein
MGVVGGLGWMTFSGLQEWAVVYFIKRTWLEVMETEVVYPHMHFISFLQK